MKDFFGAFNSEFFKPLATLLLPGLMAFLPWAVVICKVSWIHGFAASNHAEVIGALVLVCTFVGLVLEDIGSRLENCLYRRTCKMEESGCFSLEKDWFPYLRVVYDKEPIGQRYLRTLVLRLKFELGCVSAIPFALLGLWWTPLTLCERLAWTFGLAALGAYMLLEASSSTRALARLRLELLAAGQGVSR
jgi:hypothetical protein